MLQLATSGARNRGAWLDPSVLLLALYLACIYALQPAFFSATNLQAVIFYTCLLVPAVVGVHVLIVLGLFDLSVGAVASMSAVVAAKAMTSGAPISLGVLLGVVVGVSFGLLNWLFVVRFRISALIGTLITMGIARAVSLGITEGLSIGGLPEGLGRISLGSTGWIPHVVIFGAVVVGTFELLTRRHILFRRFYQVGSNPTAAMSAGINVERIKLFGFALSGAGAAMVGVLQCSRTLSASPFLFPDLALECIAACVIGGASLSGGSGRAVGAVIGMLMVVISRNVVVLVGVSVYWKELGVAVVLLAAVLLKSGPMLMGSRHRTTP